MIPHTRLAMQGKFLVSEPALLDYFFERSIILLAEHNKDGSFGVIINKPVNIKLNEVISDIPPNDFKVFLGGPVSPDNLFFVHMLGDIIEDSIPITENLYWGGNFDQIKELVAEHRISQDKIHFYLGYSGWTANQLDQELESKSWVVVNSSTDAVFSQKPFDLWREYLMKLGDKYAIWANQPMDPFLN